jgi:hypothetical protein
VYYDGKLLKASQLPIEYIPNLLLKTLPEVHWLGLGLLAISVGSTASGILHPRKWSQWGVGLVILIASVVAPVVAIWVMKANIYDGLRHVLFIVPPLVTLAGIGLSRLPVALPSAVFRTLAVSLAVLLGTLTAIDMRQIHPYQYVYFNRLFAGGVETANRLYDLDYWATGLKEAVEWAQTNFKAPPGVTVLYNASAEPEQSAMFIRKDGGLALERAEHSSKAKLHFVIRRGRPLTDVPWGKTIYQVKRAGVVLVDVIETP